MDAPLRAFVAIPGKSLFARLGDKRVRTYPSGWAGIQAGARLPAIAEAALCALKLRASGRRGRTRVL